MQPACCKAAGSQGVPDTHFPASRTIQKVDGLAAPLRVCFAITRIGPGLAQRRSGAQSKGSSSSSRWRYSSPVDEYVSTVANGDVRRLELADRGCNPPVGQVLARLVVKLDDQNSGVIAHGSDDQVMQVFEVFGVLSENRASLGDREDKRPRIRDRQQPGVGGQSGIVPVGLRREDRRGLLRFSSIRSFIPVLVRGDFGRRAEPPRGPALAR